MALADWEDQGNNLVKNKTTGQMVDRNHPIYTNDVGAGTTQVQETPGVTDSTGGAAGATPGAGAPFRVDDNTNPQLPGQTASATPNAAPTQNTTNQGGQDLYRNALMDLMAKDVNPTVDDPTIKSQLDPMRAEAERAMRGEVRSGAEEAFAGNQDFGSPEVVAAKERMGNQVGLKAADLVGRELQARRDERANYFKQFGATLSDDQARQLQKQIADMDAELRKQGLQQTGSLGNRDLDVRERIGMGGLSNDLMGILLNNQLGRDRLGLDAGTEEARLNADALRQLMGR